MPTVPKPSVRDSTRDGKSSCILLDMDGINYTRVKFTRGLGRSNKRAKIP